MNVLRRSLVYVLAALLTVPSPVFAAGIVADPAAAPGRRPDVTAAQNGVPLVNIVAPSASGLSHNQYSDFNVRREGAILNNSAAVSRTELGGVIAGNPHLAGHAPARTILNEVTGQNRSRIEGYVEVGGNRADVILANPNGVTINGGGFLNTDRALVTTGRPVVDGAGDLDRIEVREGTVRVEGKGINASNLTAFDVVSRAAEINADLYAADLGIVTGENAYDPVARRATPLTDGSAPVPRVAIDSSALGGMYAGRITLISTEKGVGVNLDGMVQARGGLTITADGRLSVRDVRAGGDALLSAADDVRVGELAGADGSLTVAGRAVEARAARLSAGGDMRITADRGMNLGGAARAEAGGALSVTAAEVRADGGSRMTGHSLDVRADRVTLADAATAEASDTAAVVSSILTVDTGAAVRADSRTLRTGELAVADGELAAVRRLTADAATLTARRARVVSGGDMTVKTDGALRLERGSSLLVVGDAALAAASLSLDGAELYARNLGLRADTLTLDNAALAAAVGRAALVASTLSARGGAEAQGTDLDIQADALALRDGTLKAGRDASVVAGRVDNERGRLLAGGNVYLNADAYTARGDRQESGADLSATAGALFAGDTLTMRLGRDLTLNGGLIAAGKAFDLGTAELRADGGALLHAGGDGGLSVSGTVALSDAKIGGGQALRLQVGDMDLTGATVSASGSLDLASDGGIRVDAGSALISAGNMNLTGRAVSNRGLIYAGSGLTAAVRDTLENLAGADILAKGDIRLTGATDGERMAELHNQAASIESLDGGVVIRAGRLFNDGGSATTTTVADGYDYTIIGWYGDTSLPHDSNAARYDPEDEKDPTAPLYPYGPDGSKNYMRLRRYLNKASGSVAAYVAAMSAQYGIPAELLGKYEGLQEWKEYSREVVDRAPAPASLMAGGDMLIEAGSLENVLSSITAGGSISIEAGSLRNQGLELSRHTNIERAFISTGGSGTWQIGAIDKAYYQLREVVDVVPAVIAAAGALNVHTSSTFNNAAMKSGEAYAGTASGTPAMTDFEVGGTLKPVERDWSDVRPRLSIVPPGGVFVMVDDPGHPYLIETDPRLTDLGTFYGSEYFFDLMGLDRNRHETRLLGDAFYETRLIREQLLDRTGSRFLFEGVYDDAETMHRLMDNAAEEGKALGLTVGTGLSAEQAARLTRDIVWLEETEYMGQTVLVPRLYLCEQTLAELDARGAVLSGGDATIRADGDVNNSGLIAGDVVRLASTADILNRGGDIIGRNALVARADGSILNQSGGLGGGDISLTAGGDIRLETLLEQVGAANGVESRVGRAAAVNASGALTMRAGNDILLSGATANAEGTALLSAGNDIVLGGESASFSRVFKGGHSSLSGFMGSAVNGGDVTLDAGGDLTLAGSRVAAENGAELQAGGDLSLIAMQGESHYYHHESRKGSMFKSGYSRTEQRDETGLVGSAVTAGGDVNLRAGTGAEPGRLLMHASSVDGGGDVSLTASGDVVAVSGEESSHSFSASSSTKFLSAKASASEQAAVTPGGSDIHGRNVTIGGGDNVLISGSTVTADEDLKVAAAGDVVVNAAAESAAARSESKRSRAGLLGLSGGTFEFYSKTTTKDAAQSVGNAGSVLSAGHDLTLDAGRDATIIGSAVAAGHDASLSAGRDVNLLPGQEYGFRSHSEKRESIGIGASFSASGLGLFAGYRATEQGLEHQGDYTAGSLVSAGNDVAVKAGRDVNQVGSHIDAGRDVALDAGRDWNMTASYDTESLHQYIKQTQVGISASAGSKAWDAVRATGRLPEELTAGRGGAGYSALTAAGAGLQYVDAVNSGLSELLSASVSAGASSSRTDYRGATSTAQPSGVYAGRDVQAEAGRDIIIEGGRVVVERDVSLDAGRDLTISAALNTGSSSTTSSSAGADVGLKGSIGASGVGGGVSMSAYASGSTSSGRSDTRVDAVITAGDTLSSLSGRDTTVAGAHLEGDSVWMDVGRDLTVASLQDHIEESGSSWSVDGEVTLGAGWSGSASVGGSTGHASSDWVNTPTTIRGRENVDIYTEGNTHIKGAVIATDTGDLVLNTGSLSFEEVRDRASRNEVGISVSMHAGMDQATAGSSLNSRPDSVEIIYSAHDKEGILRPTVSDGAILVRDNPDADTDGSLVGVNRDLEKVREIVQDEEVYADFYISPSSLAEVGSGFENIRTSVGHLINEARAHNAKLPNGCEDLGEAGLDALRALYREGVDEETATKILRDERFQSFLRYSGEVAAALQNADWDALYQSPLAPGEGIDSKVEGGITYIEINGKPIPPRQALLILMAEAADYINSIPYKEEREAALLAAQTVMGGPVKLVVSYGINMAIDYVAGDMIDAVKKTVFENFTSYLGWGISPDELTTLTLGENPQEQALVAHEATFDTFVEKIAYTSELVLGIVASTKFEKKNHAGSGEVTRHLPPNAEQLFKEMSEQGVKFTKENVIALEKMQDGRIIFLEDTPDKGLDHIWQRHGAQYDQKGIRRDDMSLLLMKAIREGNIIGYQGKGQGRPIYSVEFKGKTFQLAITVGNNGFIVGANLSSVGH